MFLSLLSFISSSTADLTPPYQSDSKGRIGHWEVGGTSLVEEQSILLVPAIQYHKGYIWTNVEIPDGRWDLELDLQIPEGNGGGGLGIWIVDTYMADGPLNGGPNHFLGLGVLLNVVTGRVTSQGLFLAVRILEMWDRQTAPFEINRPSPVAIVPFDPQNPFTVKLGFAEHNLTIAIDDKEVGNHQFQVNLSENYLGITAACESRVSRFDLLSVRFHLDGKVRSAPSFRVEDVLGEHKPSGHIHKQSTNALRGAAFNLTLREYEKLKASNGIVTEGGSADRLFGMIDELGAVNFQVASFSDLNDFVNQKLLLYAQKWQSRTVKIVERVQQARNVAGAAWNYTQEVMEAFNSSLKHTVLKTTETIGDLGSLLSELGEEGINEDHALDRLVEDANGSSFMRFLMVTAQLESVAVILFFILVSFPPIQRRLLGA